jgi:hypothetical protein
MEKIKTIAANAAVIALISVVLIWGVTGYRQWRQFSRGEQARAVGDAINAIAGYESSLHMYTPFSPFTERAAGRLWELAEELERQGERQKALIAYRSLRSSFYAVRGLTHPGTDWIKRCDERIAALVKAGQK